MARREARLEIQAQLEEDDIRRQEEEAEEAKVYEETAYWTDLYIKKLVEEDGLAWDTDTWPPGEPYGVRPGNEYDDYSDDDGF